MAEQEIQVHEKMQVEPPEGEFTREGPYFTPAVDICENETELIVMVDMPGVNGKNVEIDLRDEVLSIVGKVKDAAPVGEELLTEYRTGNYFRSFRITDIVDQEKISASLTDGVLTLVLPKSQKAVPRKIPITTG
ncbi:MAG: Hsp20/alpha crystallin family protein [Thermodesulfobacteriota bacterium]